MELGPMAAAATAAELQSYPSASAARINKWNDPRDKKPLPAQHQSWFNVETSRGPQTAFFRNSGTGSRKNGVLNRGSSWSLLPRIEALSKAPGVDAKRIPAADALGRSPVASLCLCRSARRQIHI
ncbi:hypothetical protein HPP92_000537 [Vanilla planifolia]|uniref:Uncharacterized protein n=1 Tax=Vanilla planifolia TaxID=51239 RepID=A0A835RPD0_VANPL|nr:hypothetical protein HPP92_000537 [Vanilla planifolia]